MNYGFFEELAEILAEQSAAKGREKVSEEFIDHIVKPASVEFADDQDLQNAVEQEAIDPISFYSLIANTEDTSSGSAEDKSQFMLERAREFFNVKSDVPEDLDEIPSIDADLTDVDNNQIWDVFNALNNLSHSRPAAGQQKHLLLKLFFLFWAHCWVAEIRLQAPAERRLRPGREHPDKEPHRVATVWISMQFCSSLFSYGLNSEISISVLSAEFWARYLAGQTIRIMVLGISRMIHSPGRAMPAVQ